LNPSSVRAGRSGVHRGNVVWRAQWCSLLRRAVGAVWAGRVVVHGPILPVATKILEGIRLPEKRGQLTLLGIVQNRGGRVGVVPVRVPPEEHALSDG
jgi:hypothetical protein